MTSTISIEMILGRLTGIERRCAQPLVVYREGVRCLCSGHSKKRKQSDDEHVGGSNWMQRLVVILDLQPACRHSAGITAFKYFLSTLPIAHRGGLYPFHSLSMAHNALPESVTRAVTALNVVRQRRAVSIDMSQSLQMLLILVLEVQ